MNLEEVKNQLREVNQNYTTRDSEELNEVLRQLKQRSVDRRDQPAAKEIWCFQQILDIQNNYINAYEAFKSEKYYKGWCLLENSDIEYGFLFRHFKENGGEYRLKFIYKHVLQFQSIFPYKYFMSPEFTIKEAKCGICDQVIGIRNPCGHKLGEIYDGKMCTRLLTNVETTGISLVTSPVQKYSVVFLNDPETGKSIDQYDYSFVKWVVDGLQSPFHNWDISRTKKRHPHSIYSHLKANDDCPCESGKK